MSSYEVRKKIKKLRDYNLSYGCVLLADGRYLSHVIHDKIERLKQKLRSK